MPIFKLALRVENMPIYQAWPCHLSLSLRGPLRGSIFLDQHHDGRGEIEIPTIRGHLGGAARRLLQHLQPFPGYRVLENREAGHIATGMRQTRDEAVLDGIGHECEHDGDRARNLKQRRQGRRAGSNKRPPKARAFSRPPARMSH
jgi:hypothetical protein